MRVRVATWNIHSCVGTDGRLDPERIVTVLAALDADLIGLQEVDWRHEPIDGFDQLDYLAHRLGMRAFAGPNLNDHRGRFGNGLLMRLAPSRCSHVDLSVSGCEARGAIEASFSVDGQELHVMVTHLGLSSRERLLQLASLRRRIETGPVHDAGVLLGDLNEWRPRRLVAGLAPRPFAVSSRSRTFPSRFPVLPLDVVLARPSPERFEARAVRSSLARIASDHLPVVADLAWI